MVAAGQRIRRKKLRKFCWISYPIDTRVLCGEGGRFCCPAELLWQKTRKRKKASGLSNFNLDAFRRLLPIRTGVIRWDRARHVECSETLAVGVHHRAFFLGDRHA